MGTGLRPADGRKGQPGGSFHAGHAGSGNRGKPARRQGNPEKSAPHYPAGGKKPGRNGTKRQRSPGGAGYAGE